MRAVQHVGRPSKLSGKEDLRPPDSINKRAAVDTAITPIPGLKPVSKFSPLDTGLPPGTFRFSGINQGNSSVVVGCTFLV